ncbi:MAG: DUF5752 family protein [Rhodothermales bacterium]
MHLHVLACDLDGTLAEDGVVSRETWGQLRRARRAGIALVLVTGRRLETFAENGPFAELFEAIVAEDGAAIYFPRNDSVLMPFGRVEPALIQRLEARGIPIERGMAIVATWTPHDRVVLDVLRETGGAATVEYNKGAVMILPPGATKGTGLLTALHELGYSIRNVLACGDAENDRSLFEVAEMAIAVDNATPEIKQIADIVLPYRDGEAVRAVIDFLLDGSFPPHALRRDRRLLLGHSLSDQPVHLDPFQLLDFNLGIVGSSASGKSWLAGLLTEELLRLGYQVCVIDPEGDYRGLRAFPHTLALGGAGSALPPVEDLVTLSTYSNVSLILDLSAYGIEERAAYVSSLMPALLALRARRGRPHWFLIDEIHNFCPSGGGSLSGPMCQGMQAGGFGLVGFRPSQVEPAVLDAIDNWLLTRTMLPEELGVLEERLTAAGIDDVAGQLATLPVGQAYLLSGAEGGGMPRAEIVSFKRMRRIVPHVRHLQKYLRAPLPEAKRFYFSAPGSYRGPRVASNLWEFREAVQHVPFGTLDYHLHRGDFDRWTKDVLHDEELARRLRKLARRPESQKTLREALVATVADRYEELESLI